MARRRAARRSPAARGRAVANAMAAPDFSDKWTQLAAARAAADRHSRCRTARSGERGAGDRHRAARGARNARAGPPRWSRPTAALPRASRRILQRWGIEADDSAGQPLSQTAGGHAAARASPPRPSKSLAPVAAAGAAQASAGRRRGRRAARLARRGARARPGACAARARAPGLTASTTISPSKRGGPRLAHGSRRHSGAAGSTPLASRSPLDRIAAPVARGGRALAGDAAWRGPDGRLGRRAARRA